MRVSSFVLVILALLPSTLVAQATTISNPVSSRVSTLVGAGNSFSGVGILADFRPFARGPLSLVASVGSVPAYFGDGSDASIALALGVRASAGHGHHQGFVELALLPVDVDVIGHLEYPPRQSLLYGLGLQVGYRLTLADGLTANLLGGPGHALNKDVAASRLKPLIGFGFGYAWPRR
jgi:hypothetical protein